MKCNKLGVDCNLWGDRVLSYRGEERQVGLTGGAGVTQVSSVAGRELLRKGLQHREWLRGA